MENLQEEFRYFTDNHKKLFEKYPNKFVVVKDKQIQLHSDTFVEALSLARSKGYEPGTFLIQQCTKDESGFTQSFHSRVVFS